MTASHLTISIKAASNIVQISTNWAYFDLQKHRRSLFYAKLCSIDTGLFPVKAQLLIQRKMAMKSPWEYFTTVYHKLKNLEILAKKELFERKRTQPSNYQVKQENPVVFWQDIT